MFGTIRKHSQALWIPIIIVVIISFVVYFTPDFDPFGERGGSGLSADEAEVQTAKQHELIGEALMLSMQFRGFLPPSVNPDTLAGQMRPHNLMGNDFQALQEYGELDDHPGLDYRARLRLLRLQKADSLGLVVSHDTAVARIESLFTQTGKSFSQDGYNAFLKPLQDNGFLSPGEAGKNEFREFVRQEIILGHPVITQGEMGLLDQLMTRSSGFFPDHTITADLAERNKKFTTEAVFFPTATLRTNVTTEIDANATLLTNHFQTVAHDYFIPPKQVIGYVKISTDFYQRDAEKNFKTPQGLSFPDLVLDRIKLHRSSPTNSVNVFKDANGTKLPDGPALTTAAEADVRLGIKGDLDTLTMPPAKKEAEAFARQLFDEVPDEQWTITRLRDVSQKWADGKTRQPLAYLETTLATGSEGPPLPALVLTRADRSLAGVPVGTLDERYIEVPGDGIYFIGYVRTQPGKPRTLAQLDDLELAKVKTSCINAEIAKRAETAGAKYKTAVDKAIADGNQTFAQYAQENNATHPYLTLPAMPRSPTNRVEELDGLALTTQLMGALPHGPEAVPGWISDYTSADNARSAGFLLHLTQVKDGPPPSPSELQNFADGRRRMARNFSSSLTTARFGMVPPWLAQEVKVLDAELAVVTFLDKITEVEFDHAEAETSVKTRAVHIADAKAGKKQLPGNLTVEILETRQREDQAKMAGLRLANEKLITFLEAAHEKYYGLTKNDQYADRKNDALAKAKAFAARHAPPKK